MYVACMGQNRDIFGGEICETHLEDLGVDVRIILKCVFKRI